MQGPHDEHPDQLGWELVLEHSETVEELMEMGKLLAKEGLPEPTLELLSELRQELRALQGGEEQLLSQVEAAVRVLGRGGQ